MLDIGCLYLRIYGTTQMHLIATETGYRANRHTLNVAISKPSLHILCDPTIICLFRHGLPVISFTGQYDAGGK